MDDTIITYGKQGIYELLAIIPQLHFAPTMLSSIAFIIIFKPKNVKIEALISFISFVIWGVILMWYAPDMYFTKEGILSVLISGITAVLLIISRRQLLKIVSNKIRVVK